MAMNPLESEAIFAERFLRIICVGAGASGLLLAYKLSKHFDDYSLTVRPQILIERKVNV
jgi:ketopantoate reductase